MFTVGFVKEICGCYYVQLSLKIFLVNLGAWPLLNALMENYSRVKLKRLSKYINKTLVKPKCTTHKSSLKLSRLKRLMLLSALNRVSSLPDFHTGPQIELRKSVKNYQNFLGHLDVQQVSPSKREPIKEYLINDFNNHHKLIEGVSSWIVDTGCACSCSHDKRDFTQMFQLPNQSF